MTEQEPLHESDLADDPMTQFARWYEPVLEHGGVEPTAMTLATVDADGMPSTRIVLLKSHDRDGFVFYTNYSSRKGRELDANPRCSLLFWWGRFYRQVRVEGFAERVPPAESDRYFQSRPRGSQLGAWASAQSRPLPDRDTLLTRLAEYEERYRDAPVPRPPDWGGYIVRPNRIEFWQAGPDRLHDRLEYEKSAEGEWAIRRLAP